MFTYKREKIQTTMTEIYLGSPPERVKAAVEQDATELTYTYECYVTTEEGQQPCLSTVSAVDLQLIHG